jgi:hypothetical protein
MIQAYSESRLMLKPFQKHGSHNDLKNLIAYLASTVSHLQEVKLDKLIYIAQLYHYANYGELLTRTRFFSMSYGPHAPTIRSTVKKQIEEKTLYLEESRTSSDPVYSNPCLIIRSYEHKDKDLSSLCLNTLQEVVQEWGDKPYKSILDYTTRTIPFLATRYREPIDLTQIIPFHNLKHALSLPARIQIHKFVEDPDKAISNDMTCGDFMAVSINEVAEIYLALRGGLPDRIPSQSWLGFDLQAINLAMRKLDEDVTEKHPVEFEKAAQLTVNLLESMSFRSYSGRVALKTGMLFLKRHGYFFRGDVLEDHWPEGNSQRILSKWFRRLSAKVDTN